MSKNSQDDLLKADCYPGMYKHGDVGKFSYKELINTDKISERDDNACPTIANSSEASDDSSQSVVIDNLLINDIEQLDIDHLLAVSEKFIAKGVLPVRIPKGSSGSYFIKDSNGSNLAVFKPKNEEPYGHLNPKWQKWIQKVCLPCCFGRSCILANHGYLSEVGASVVDTFFDFGVAPKTTVAWLSSEAFYYHKIDYTGAAAKKLLHEKLPKFLRKKIRLGLPLKIGSFQKFVSGFKDACEVLPLLPKNFIETELGKKFLLKFERLVALDYIIRNTDRGNDNWLMKIEEPLLTPAEDDFVLGCIGDIKIAAIDNGLAFPYKHPDSWRSYPFNWAYLPYAQCSFSEEFKAHVLSIITNPERIGLLLTKLRTLFKIDKSFNKATFESQMKVLRGQVYDFTLLRFITLKLPWNKNIHLLNSCK